MNILDKLGMIYSFLDCGSRHCGNCVARDFCGGSGSKERLNFINEISAEVRTIIKERDEAIAKVNAQITSQEEANEKER